MSNVPGGARPRYSVSSLVAYEACPFQYYETYIRKIPPPRTPAMMRGLSVHSLISRHYRKQPLPAPIDSDALRLFERFKQSRFNVLPIAFEKSFVLPLEHGDVSGRIDVILPDLDGGVELVDFKSGVGRDREELSRHLQLPLYAAAAQSLFEVEPEKTGYTYYFLGSDGEEKFRASAENQREVVSRVERIMDVIQEGRFDPRPDCGCFACTRANLRRS